MTYTSCFCFQLQHTGAGVVAMDVGIDTVDMVDTVDTVDIMVVIHTVAGVDIMVPTRTVAGVDITGVRIRISFSLS